MAKKASRKKSKKKAAATPAAPAAPAAPQPPAAPVPQPPGIPVPIAAAAPAAPAPAAPATAVAEEDDVMSDEEFDRYTQEQEVVQQIQPTTPPNQAPGVAVPIAPAAPAAPAPAAQAPAAPAPAAPAAPAPAAPAPAPTLMTPVATPTHVPAQPAQMVVSEVPAILNMPYMDRVKTTQLDAPPAEHYPILQMQDGAGQAMQFNMSTGFGFSAWQLPRIKLASGGNPGFVKTTPEGVISVQHFGGIILYVKDGRSLWMKEMGDGGGNNPPDCESPDGSIGRGNPGGQCAICPYAQWGSMAELFPHTKSKSKGQACRHTSMIFIMEPGSQLPTVMVIPPTSLKTWKQYLFGLASSAQRYIDVVTTFSTQIVNVGGFNVNTLNCSRVQELENEQSKKVFSAAQGYASIFHNVVPTHGEVGTDGGA